jgi:c-di-AMP phosphodiesterase-like protein
MNVISYSIPNDSQSQQNKNLLKQICQSKQKIKRKKKQCENKMQLKRKIMKIITFFDGIKCERFEDSIQNKKLPSVNSLLETK